LRDWCVREFLRLEQVCKELTSGPPSDKARRIIYWAWQLRIVEFCKWRSSDPLVHVHRLQVALMLMRQVIMLARTNDWRERYVLERGKARTVAFETPKIWQQDPTDRIELYPFGAYSILNFETSAKNELQATDLPELINSAALDALRHFDVRAKGLMKRLWQPFVHWPPNDGGSKKIKND